MAPNLAVWFVYAGLLVMPIADSQAFAAFDEPDYAKVTFNLFVEEEGGGWSRVRTETRVFATDPSAARKFGVYWRVIYPGSATIRRMWLKAIKHRAERGSVNAARSGIPARQPALRRDSL